MYKVLTIGGRDYKLEYTIEASMYEDCIDSLMGFFSRFGELMAGANIPDNLSEEEREKLMEKYVKKSISGISNIPATAVTLFHAGLLEYHGANGDNSIRSKQDTKELVKQYFKDHAEDGTDNFYDLLLICVNQMGEDGFFKRTGLEKMLQSQTKTNSPVLIQDHKKKAKTTKA